MFEHLSYLLENSSVGLGMYTLDLGVALPLLTTLQMKETRCVMWYF